MTYVKLRRSTLGSIVSTLSVALVVLLAVGTAGPQHIRARQRSTEGGLDCNTRALVSDLNFCSNNPGKTCDKNYLGCTLPNYDDDKRCVYGGGVPAPGCTEINGCVPRNNDSATQPCDPVI